MSIVKLHDTWGHEVTSAPSVEPVTRAAYFKDHIMSDETDIDNYIDEMLKAARQVVEVHLGRKLITQTVQIIADSFPGGDIELPFPPVQSITSIAYRDTAGSNQTETGYTLRAGNNNKNAVLQQPTSGWPSTDEEPQAVTITMVCGYGDAASDVPEAIKFAIMQLASSWYAQRESISPVNMSTVPQHLEWALSAYRTWY